MSAPDIICIDVRWSWKAVAVGIGLLKGSHVKIRVLIRLKARLPLSNILLQGRVLKALRTASCGGKWGESADIVSSATLEASKISGSAVEL